MTENEAIERLKCMRLFMKLEDKENKSKFLDSDYEANHMAIKALETVQKYKDLESELSKRNLTIDHIREYIQFEDECVKHEFTFKSLLEAREKQSGNNPILSMYEKGCMAIDYADGRGEIKQTENNFWRCPKCKSVVGERIIVHDRIHDQRKKKYCENCGQKIDWEVVKNE
jgi:hypothetical protein